MVQLPADERIPAALDLAVRHHGTYALRLSSGEVLFFGDAQLHGEWIHLQPSDDASGWGAYNRNAGILNPLPFSARAGIDVRLDQIVWAAVEPFDG